MKLCSRLNAFVSKFLQKNDKFGYLKTEPHFWKVRSDARPWLMARWKPMVDLLFTLIELSSLSVMVPKLWGEMCTVGWSHRGSTFLHSNFTWTGSSPINHSNLGVRKLEALGYPMVKTTSFCVLWFGHNTVVWWMDGQICRSIYSTCRASFVVHTVKQKYNLFEIHHNYIIIIKGIYKVHDCRRGHK